MNKMMALGIGIIGGIILPYVMAHVAASDGFVNVPYSDDQAVSAAMGAGMMTGVSGDCSGSGPGSSAVTCTKTNGSNFGTMATQSSGSVVITGGSIAGVSMVLPSSTISALPTCNAGATGQVRMVTDALLPSFLVTIAAGGSVKLPVFCNGTNWVAF